MALTKLSTDVIDLSGNTEALTIPSGTSANRPTSPAEGLLRDNTTTGALEFYDGSIWQQIAGTLVPDYSPPVGTDHFMPTLFNGNNTTVTTGFQADFVWLANRQYANGNFIYDSVRGASNNLWPTSNDAEGVRSGVTAFNPTSTTIGTYASIGSGGSGNNVQWAWKAGGTAVSNPDGTTTSTISKNATSGFSIVKTSSAGGTINVGHGLGSDIGMIILKGVDVAEAWQVWHKDVGTGKYLQLSSDAAPTTRTNSFSTVSSTIFENDWTSGSVVWIAYCFADVTDYQKMGTYTGAVGKEITLGFQPRFVLIKRIDSAYNWLIYDSVRGSSGALNDRYAILPDSGASAEITSSVVFVNFTSTGIDFPNSYGGTNATGGEYIYLAIA